MSEFISIFTSLQTIVFASAVATILVYFQNLKEYFFGRLQDSAGNGIPPGPVGLPIVGSHPFLTHFPELTIDRWAKQYGPLYSVWLGNQLFMMISDPQIVKDLMVTNGAVFSSRKEMFLKSKKIFVGRGITAT
ncbi:hypothetical protein V5O48_007239, partial [Marasmius crinis-equi]